nr:fumarylacetoacetate hydrolase family protein [Streptomyces sp. JV178]
MTCEITMKISHCQHVVRTPGGSGTPAVRKVIVRFVTYTESDGDRVGVLDADDLVHALPPGIRLIDLLDDPQRLHHAADNALRDPRAVHPYVPLRLRAPIPQPPTVRDFRTFESHIEGVVRLGGPETGPPEQWYEAPAFYFTNPYAIHGPQDDVRIPPGCRRFDFELEVAAVIGRGGRDLSLDEAESHIAGYVLMNDWSARDLQFTEMQVRLGPAKGKDSATTLGPVFVAPDELEPYRAGNAYNMRMTARHLRHREPHPGPAGRRRPGDTGHTDPLPGQHPPARRPHPRQQPAAPHHGGHRARSHPRRHPDRHRHRRLPADLAALARLGRGHPARPGSHHPHRTHPAQRQPSDRTPPPRPPRAHQRRPDHLAPRTTRAVRRRPALPPRHPTGVHGLPGRRPALPGLVASFAPEHVVPGHGPVIDAHALPAVLDQHRAYYRLVHTTAQAGLRDGLTPLQAARTCHLGPFADLPDAERIVLNLHRAYADTTGHPFDLPQAFTDAITYNSGPCTPRSDRRRPTSRNAHCPATACKRLH